MILTFNWSVARSNRPIIFSEVSSLKTKNGSKLANIIAYALIGTIAFILMFIAFPLPVASFLKFDFSDVIVTIGTFLFGAGPGIFIAFIRMFISLIYKGFSLPSIVGQLAAFVATISFALPFYFFTKKIDVHEKNMVKRHLQPILGVILGIIAMTLVLSVLNALVLTPVYAVTTVPNLPKIDGYSGLLSFTEKVYLRQLLHIPSMTSYIAGIIVPFNLVKGAINGIVVYLLFETVLGSLKPFVQRYFNLKN
ncbi:ECF transporter S component [Lactobacillus bombicola]|uniref:ECF transporter S component n=1 Tax=Lactobacillus bombicola TaxID=1505723 RepID=A0A396T0G2_9LACO|nr:ECF transporter S component [Lactobacillus bombicola]MCO6528234.1 ECF transporter S component [Lactobacillus sp.]RHW50486.1 ECF transporter S component [Lactobacillus bombicola]RHW53100.1 ECF transporter S component [Lactobacillus bombicola]RHW54596.1 ECF transporter S component [Lactobacillus bombicola]